MVRVRVPAAGRPSEVSLLAADAGTFAALGGRHIGMAGVDVAPPQAGLQSASPHRVVAVGIGDDELFKQFHADSTKIPRRSARLRIQATGRIPSRLSLMVKCPPKAPRGNHHEL